MAQPPRSTLRNRRIAGRAQEDHIRDPYEVTHKLHEPTVCVGCGAIYHHGRWQWSTQPEAAHQDHCPACRRIADAFPAGILSVHGDFARNHKDEIANLARNEEAAEKAEHPLNRIMGVQDIEDGFEIQTTDIHLPHRIGRAVQRAFHGELNSHFDEKGYFVRVEWRRNA